jgi:hypothetical protein
MRRGGLFSCPRFPAIPEEKGWTDVPETINAKRPAAQAAVSKKAAKLKAANAKRPQPYWLRRPQALRARSRDAARS